VATVLLVCERRVWAAVRLSAGGPSALAVPTVHDSVFDLSHQLIHSWTRERSSAIRNLRPARLPQLGDFGTISQVPQPRKL